uniref:ANAPC4_WD40 domain-containing protein n=1 Tax=Ascaris lumbricoides TaxID=6252 RepID=A0A0M3IPX8_ASCLU
MSLPNWLVAMSDPLVTGNELEAHCKNSNFHVMSLPNWLVAMSDPLVTGNEMGITKQYLRYVPSGTCNIVGSTNGAVAAVNDVVCAVSACENVNFYNLRTCERTLELSESEKCVTALKFSSNRQFIAIGYADGVVRLHDRKSEGILDPLY